MTDNVIKLEVIDGMADIEVAAKGVLQAGLEHSFESLVVIGRETDGNLYVAGTHNAGTALFLIKQAEHFLVFGKDAAE